MTFFSTRASDAARFDVMKVLPEDSISEMNRYEVAPPSVLRVKSMLLLRILNASEIASRFLSTMTISRVSPTHRVIDITECLIENEKADKKANEHILLGVRGDGGTVDAGLVDDLGIAFY